MMSDELGTEGLERLFLWELEIEEITGESLEAKNREAVNKLLSEGWIILHIYTLKYKEEEDVWRERPMAIFGRPAHLKEFKEQMHQVTH